MSAANLDVTVMVARAERRVLAAARALYAARAARSAALAEYRGDPTDDVKGTKYHAARAALLAADEDFLTEVEDLALADAAEDAEIAAYEADLARRQAEHEADLDAAEVAAEAADSAPDYANWYTQYESEMDERARCEQRGGLS